MLKDMKNLWIIIFLMIGANALNAQVFSSENNELDTVKTNIRGEIFKTLTITVTEDYNVPNFKRVDVTSACVNGIDNTITLPDPSEELRGYIIEVTHLDTSAAQSRTTTVETDGTSYHIYDNFTGDTLTFFNIYTSGQTVRFTLKEIEGVLRWVAVNLSPVVFGNKELTAVGKIRQGEDGDLYAYDGSVSGERKVQYQYTVDSVAEILNLKVRLNDRIKVKGTGAEYLVQTGSVSGYATDSIAVIDLNNSFAVLQPQNNAYFIEWFGAVSGDAINDSEAIQKSINFLRVANGNTIKSQSNDSKFIVNDNINIDLFGGKNLYIEIQDTLYRAPSANSSGYLFSVNRSERVYFKYLTIASDNEFPSAIPAHNPAGCVDETCNLTSNFNGIAIGNIGDNGNVIIDNCTFLNLGFAIDANGTQQIEVSNSVMIGCYFGITGGGNSSIVVNNLFHGVDSLQTIENTPHTLYLNNYLNVAVNNLHCGGEYQGQMYSSLDTPIKIGNSVSKDTASLNFNNINIFVPSTTDRGCSGRIVIEAIPVNSNWNNITSTNLVHSGPIFMSIFGVTKGVNASNVILNWPKSTGGTLLDFNAADQSANFSNLIVEGSAKINLRNNNLFNCVNCSYENPREKIFTGTDITQTSYANYTNLSVSFIDSNSVNLFDVRNSIIQVDGLNIRIDNATASTIAEVREGSVNVPRRFIRIHNAILDTLYSDVGELIDTPGYTSSEPAFFVDGRYTDGAVISLSNTPYLDEIGEIVLPENIKSTGSALFGTGQSQTTSISNGDIRFDDASTLRKVLSNLLISGSPIYQRIQFYGSGLRVAVMNEDGLSLASRPNEATNFPSATLDVNGTFKLTGDADFPELDTIQSQNTTLRDTTAATAAFTIRIGEENHINTAGGSVTAQVPAGAQIGDVFSVYAGESAGTNSATIDFNTNGYTVLGANTRTFNTSNQYEKYRYKGDGKWVIVSTTKTNTLTGWAQYSDDQYTSVSPLTIAAGDTVTVFNNVASSITTDLPIGIDSLWNRTDSTIIAQNVGDAYTIRIDFIAENSSNDGYFDWGIDIGGTQNFILQDTYMFPKGQNTPHKYSVTHSIYTLNTFIANGGKIKIIGGVGTTEIYDVDFVITRVHASPD